MNEDAGPSLAGEPDSTGSEEREDRPTVERDVFRDAMARLPAAVNIVTTDGPAGRAGFTASAVCSVTDRPPTLLVCLNRAASVHDVFSANEALCVNTLRPDHEPLARLFGGKTAMPARFAGGSWTTAVTGAPVLVDAAVSFDCRVVRTTVVGTHNVLFCEVVAVRRFGSPEALLYYDRGYRSL